jgi:hypothetical protein
MVFLIKKSGRSGEPDTPLFMITPEPDMNKNKLNTFPSFMHNKDD